MPVLAQITVARRTANCDWLGLGHMLSPVAKGPRQNTVIGTCPQNLRFWARRSPISEVRDAIS